MKCYHAVHSDDVRVSVRLQGFEIAFLKRYPARLEPRKALFALAHEQPFKLHGL